MPSTDFFLKQILCFFLPGGLGTALLPSILATVTAVTAGRWLLFPHRPWGPRQIMGVGWYLTLRPLGRSGRAALEGLHKGRNIVKVRLLVSTWVAQILAANNTFLV